MLIGDVRRARFSIGPAAFQALALALIAASMALQAWLIFVQEFNWDEFYFLGFVHDYLRGELSTALQTIHVHIFAPLAQLPGTEIDQLIAGRLVMLLCEAITFLALYKLCRVWTDRGPSLFALAAYALVPATLQHGASFRTDPLALALAMTALAWVAKGSPGWKSAAGIALLISLAALVTVKIVFFAPAFAGIALWRVAGQDERKTTVRWLAAIGLLAPIFFLLLYALHQASLPQGSIAGSTAMMEGAARKTLIETRLFPRQDVLLDNLWRAPVQWLLLLAGTILLATNTVSRPQRMVALAIMGCVAPMLCLVIYRNAFPYFVPFIVAPAFTAIAWLVQTRRWPAAFQLVLALIMAMTAIPSVQRIASRGQDKQRAVVTGVHEIFPQPVAMIDHSHMISSFPKRGFFMSTWGLANYRRHQPVFADILEREPVPLLLLDSPVLADAVGAGEKLPPHRQLQDKDRAVLASNYLQHWGPIWVAGQSLAVSPRESLFEMLIPGRYTLEGGAVALDGHQVAPGEVVELNRGQHRISASSEGTVTLRWGHRLSRPTAPPPVQPMFQGF